MSDELKRTRGICVNCRDSFHIQKHNHVKWGGMLWCSESCLAEYAVENEDRNVLPTDPDKIALEMESVKNDENTADTGG